MLVTSGAIVVLTAAADPWTWMVVATSLAAAVWLALTYLGAWLRRATSWIRTRSGRRHAAQPPGTADRLAPAGRDGEGTDPARGHT